MRYVPKSHEPNQFFGGGGAIKFEITNNSHKILKCIYLETELSWHKTVICYRFELLVVAVQFWTYFTCLDNQIIKCREKHVILIEVFLDC